MTTEWRVLPVEIDDRPATADDLLDWLHSLRPAWHEHAACRGQWETMWPTLIAGRQDQFADAVKVCAGCPVIVECGEAGKGEHHGVWGGVPKWPGRRDMLRDPESRDRVMQVFRSADRPLTPAELGQRCGFTTRSAHRWITRLDDERVITPAGGGRWKLAAA